MKKSKNQDGYILILCMLCLVVLTIIGLAAVKNTGIELQVAGNDNLRKKTLYGAEAGAMGSAEVLEQNINCPIGFSQTGAINGVNVADLEGNVRVYSRSPYDLAMYLNSYPWTTTDCNITNTGSPNLAMPIANIGTGVEEIKVWVGGVANKLPGGSQQMAAGYEGKGKSAASGGAMRQYDIISSNEDVRNAKCNVLFGWRHVIGNEGNCNY